LQARSTSQHLYTESLHTAEGTITVEGIPPRWTGLYHVAMQESDRNKLSALLDYAINAVLDQIEEALTHNELEELNNALNGLRSRRKEVSCSNRGQADSPDQTKAA
jgi:hypothetical protein